jgi:hypothetical protein
MTVQAGSLPNRCAARHISYFAVQKLCDFKGAYRLLNIYIPRLFSNLYRNSDSHFHVITLNMLHYPGLFVTTLTSTQV